MKALIFDLDGTLLYTLADLRASLNYALAAKGLPLRSLEQVRGDVGNGVRVLIERSLEAPEQGLVDELLHIFRPHYAQHALDHTRPYDGIMDMLRECRHRGYRSAIVSNKPDAQVKALHQRFFPSLIDIAVGEQLPEVPRKPAPDMVFLALRSLGVSVKEALYVGDSEVDLATAQNAGLPCIGCAWGFRGRERLRAAGCAAIIDHPRQLLERVKSEGGLDGLCF